MPIIDTDRARHAIDIMESRLERCIAIYYLGIGAPNGNTPEGFEQWKTRALAKLATPEKPSPRPSLDLAPNTNGDEMTLTPLQLPNASTPTDLSQRNWPPKTES